MISRRCEKCFKKHASYYPAKEAWLCKDCLNTVEEIKPIENGKKPNGKTR